MTQFGILWLQLGTLNCVEAMKSVLAAPGAIGLANHPSAQLLPKQPATKVATDPSWKTGQSAINRRAEQVFFF